jgi:hypothetical protein
MSGNGRDHDTPMRALSHPSFRILRAEGHAPSQGLHHVRLQMRQFRAKVQRCSGARDGQANEASNTSSLDQEYSRASARGFLGSLAGLQKFSDDGGAMDRRVYAGRVACPRRHRVVLLERAPRRARLGIQTDRQSEAWQMWLHRSQPQTSSSGRSGASGRRSAL